MNTENKAIELIKKVNVEQVSCIHTLDFINELTKILNAGLSDELCIEYIVMMNNQFDSNGMDKGTDYTNTILAFPKPEIHRAFNFDIAA